MAKVIYSTDTDLIQSTLIVLDINTNTHNNCIYLEDLGNDKFNVYSFDLLNTLNDWYDLRDIESFTGQKYNELEQDFNFWCNFTNDVCSYYGAINLDSYPQKIKAKKIVKFIKTI